MNSVALLDIQPGTFTMPSEISLPSDLRKAEFNIRLRLRLFYQKTRDFVMTEVSTVYSLKDQKIMSFDMILGFHIEEWAKKLDTLTDITRLREDMVTRQLAEISIGTMRGSIFERTRNTPLAQLFLPIADIHRVIEKCDFVNMDDAPDEP